MCEPDYEEWEHNIDNAFQTLFQEWRSSELGIDEQEGKSESSIMMGFLSDMMFLLIDLKNKGKLDKPPEDKNIGVDRRDKNE